MAEAGLSSFNPPGQPPSTPWSEVIGNAFNRWLDQRQAEILEANKNTNPRSVAGDVISTAMNILPAGPRMAVPRGQGIRAYHGSPYDFDRFDLSKIGTGEGAQAYGHGLYFAENPKTATAYRNTLAEPKISVTDSHGTRYDPLTHKDGGVRDAAGFLAESGGDINHAIAEWRAFSAKYPNEDRITRAGSVLNGWKDRGFEFSPGGKMYEVNINAKPEQFLDWDRPLAPDSAARAAALDAIKKPGLFTTEPERTLRATSRDKIEGNPALTGHELYSSLSRRLGAGNYRDAQASDVLRDAGIPGIRYLDQGSRTPGYSSLTPAALDARIQSLRSDIASGGGNQARMAEQLANMEHERANYKPQTRNYVLFNDKIVYILRKWGVIGPTVGAGAAAATQDQSQ